MWRVRPPVLALGGGGARGFAHLGVLEVLEEAGLGVRAIAGTSMGAVVGAMVLAHGSARSAAQRWREAIAEGRVPSVRNLKALPDADLHEHPLLQVARRIRNRLVVSFAMNRETMLDDKDLMRAFEFLLPDVDIEELGRPFVAVATDAETGEEIRLSRGSLRTVLKASSAIPGMLPATPIDGRLLLDGGVVAEVPVAAARSLGRPVVAVDVSIELGPLRPDDLVLDTMMRAQAVTLRLLRETHLAGADYVLRPRVGSVTWADWSAFDSMVETGRVAARAFLGIDGPPRGEEPPADPPTAGDA
jgi:NTE family protein